MEIRITKKQNVVVDGVKYKAKNSYGGCAGCAFRREVASACDAAPCANHARDDKREVIFVVKKKKDLK